MARAARSQRSPQEPADQAIAIRLGFGQSGLSKRTAAHNEAADTVFGESRLDAGRRDRAERAFEGEPHGEQFPVAPNGCVELYAHR